MPDTRAYILMIGCFDTKGEIFSSLRDHLLRLGNRVVAVNTGILGTTGLFPVDIEAEEVAEKAGQSLLGLRAKSDRGYAVEVMGRGAAEVVSSLFVKGGLKAAIGMGGGGGTYIALSALKEIPLGIPKVCVSTLAAKDLTRHMGSKDIVLIPSVVDVAGLNSISEMIIGQAAAAISAMANAPKPAHSHATGRIAISMFGNTTPCVDQCTKLLESAGYEVFAFHANGQGGRTMEALIRERYFDGVLDITTTELADELSGGICSAGPERLTAASDLGIPQVVVPGCMDMVNFGPVDTIPEKYQHRQLYSWAPDVTLMRTNKEENTALGGIMAEKIGRSAAPVAVLLPLSGLSQMDREGQVFFDPDANRLLFNSLRNALKESVQVVEVNAHINEASFAEKAVETLRGLIEKKEVSGKSSNFG